MSAFSGSIDVSNIINELQDLIGKGSKTSVDELTQAIDRAKKAVKALKDEQDGLNQSMAAMTERNEITNSLKQLQSGLEAVTKSLQRLREDVTSTNKKLEELSLGSPGGSNGGGSNAWGDFETQLKNINLTSEDLKNNFLDVKTTMDSSGTSVTTYNNNLDTTVKVYKRATEEGYQYKVTLEKINQENKNAVSNAKYINSSTEALKRLGLEAGDVNNIIQAMNGKSTSSWMVAKQSISANGDAVYELRNNLDKVVTVTQKNVDGTNQFSASLKNVANNAKEATKEAGTWGYSWKRAWQSFLTYMSVTDIFFRVKNAIVDMVHEVEELDAALVELQKVTDLEGDSLEKFIDDAYKAGEEVAKTGTEMIEAATAFAKAGYKENALELGKVAAMYTNIADEAISAADAADMIIAQMKAFNIEAENSIHIIDAINEVSNNFAVSSADISRNLGKASAVMANAGNSMEQYIGLITAATEQTRNASKAANGLKTITLRLQGMNDEGEKDLELTAQMEAMFKKLGISVYDANGELKNTYDILGTLAPVYQKLSNAEKAFVTETIAGKFQAQNAAAILNNWSNAVAATETAMNSAGSATKENAKVLDSIQGHLQRLSSSWEELSHKLIDSDLIKFVIDLGNILLKFANSGVGQTLIKLSALFLAIKGLSSLLSLAYSKILLTTSSVLKNTVAVIANGKALQNVNKQTKDYITKLLLEKGAIDKNTGSIKTQTLLKIKAKLASEGLSQAEQTEILKTITLTATQGAAAKATGLFATAMKGLGAALAANPIGVFLFAVTGLISGLKYLSEDAQRAQERFEKLKEELDEANQKLQATEDELKKTRDRITELKSKGKLTFTEKAELDNLEKANLKLETQAELYERIAKAKEDATKRAANEAYNKEYNNEFSYRQITNSGELKGMEWYDYINPKHIYDFFSSNTANYGYDTDIITEAVNLYDDLNEKRKDGIKLTEDEQKKFDNLETSLATELESLEERIPNLTGKTKKEAQELRDYIVRFVYPEIFQKEQANTFFGVDPDDDAAQKIKNQFKDIQEQMDILYQKGELTSKKIWELRKDDNGEWNDLDKYMRESGLDNEAIITYYDTIYKKEEEVVKKEKDIWKTAAEERQKYGLSSMTDDSFLGYLSGEYTTNASSVLEWYEALKQLAEGGEISAESIRKLDEQFKFLASDEYALEDIAGILDYFSADAQDTLSNYSTKLDNITAQYNLLTGAVDEFNEAGYLTSETYKKILDNGLIDYLSFENGQLVANTSDLYKSAEASRIYASQQLTAAMTADVLNIAVGKEEEVSGLAASAIANLGNASATAGGQVDAATGKFIGFAEAVDQANKALSGKEITNDIQKKITAVQNAYKPFYDLLSKPIQINTKKYDGSSKDGSRGSSSNSVKQEKEWWEQALEALKNQFNYSDITIEQYIGGLQNILNQLDKGSDAWHKINQELQKQRLEKIKDDYNAGRISLTQYIKELKNLQLAYKAGTDGWNKLADAIKKAELDQLKQQQNDLKAALSAVTNTIDKQIDKYQELKDAADDKYDDELDKLKELKDALNDDNDDYERAQKAVVKFLNEQLDSIDKEKESVESYYDYVIDAIEAQNDAQEESLKLAEAYEAWMNAMTQKTKKVWREGLGWVWEADSKAIEEAKKNYDDLVHQASVKELEKQKDSTVKSLEEQIEALEAYIDSWDEVFDKFDNEKNTNLANLLLGENWTEMVSNLDPQVVEDFSNAYYDLQKNIEETEKQIEDLNKLKEEEDEYWDKLINDLKEYKGQWSDIADIYEDAQDALKAKQLIGAEWERQILEQRLDVLENFKNKYNAILAEIDKVDNMSTNNASGYNPYSLPGYSNGGEVDFTGLAMLHGSKSRPEYVLNNDQMKNLLSNLTRPQYTSNFGAVGSQVINNYSFGNIDLPNVQNAQQFINELKSLVNTTKNL